MKGRILAALWALVLFSGCAASRYGVAEGELKRGEYVQALRSYLRGLEPHARDGKRFIYYEREAVTGLGVTYWHMERYETALKILRLVTEKDPDFGKAYFYMGLAYESLGDEANAISMYRRYIRIDPGDPFRHVLAGRYDFLAKRKITHEIENALKNEAQMDASATPERSVAVLSFLNLGENREWEPLQKGLADMVIRDLSGVDGLNVVDRTKLDQILYELGLNASSLGDSAAARRVGTLAGARYLVKGSFLVMPDMKMTLDAGVHPFQKADQPTTFSEDGNLSTIFQMEKQIVLRIVDYFGITLTTRQKETILDIPTENVSAFLNYCRGLDALDSDDYGSAYAYFRQAVREDPDFRMAKDWLIVRELWDATHAQNLRRVDRDVAFLTRRGARARLSVENQPELFSTSGRLQWMSLRQNAGFLPGTDSRKSFQEAGLSGAPVLPQRLGEPPVPPPAR
jgi:tetratricopeptide (TPR) repeat protein